MYFATNFPAPTLASAIAKEFEELRAMQRGGSMHLFALVDCAFDEEFLHARYRRTVRLQSLYENTGLQGFAAAAPHLLRSPAGEGEPLAWLNHLFAVCGNKPMLSIITSRLSADELARHMHPYLIAMTSDTVEWPVRWGDTRVLPALLEVLTESQRGHFLGPIGRWWSPARDGSLRRWNGTAHLSTAAGFNKLPLSDEAFFRLVEGAEADAVLTQIEEWQPDVLRRLSPAECHAVVQRYLTVATANGIEAASARRHFSVLALVLNEDFLSHAEVVRLLEKTRGGADYASEASLLSTEFWRDMTAI